MNRAYALVAGLDVQSRSVVRRFAVLFGLYAFWSAVIGGRHWSGLFVAMSSIGAVIEMSIALYNREKITRSSLSRWDMAAAFIGLSCLARAVA
jgi:hypothetical protein